MGLLCFVNVRYPGTGEYVNFDKEGIYGCVGCKAPLYKSTTKFNAGCGWPAFFDGIPGAITRTVKHSQNTYTFHQIDSKMKLSFCFAYILDLLCFISQTQMGEEQRSTVQHVVDILVMFSKEKVLLLQPMNVIA